MTNADVIAKYGDINWLVEENLDYLLIDFYDEIKRKNSFLKLPSDPGFNFIGFIKDWLRKETICNTKYADQALQDTLKSKLIVTDAEYKIIEG